MEASALHAPAGLSRFPRGGGLLRLRSDEQLVAAFRSGNDEAFRIIHDRYRQRLFAYVRQMLASCSRQDAEDVLQDVFVRAYGALRNDNREMNVRAWLYRVAHNRCIDHLRRPVPPAAEIFEVSRKPLHDPVEEAQRRDDLRRLVADVGNLPEQQRSALLMREIDGMTYADLANALDVTVPAVKSLLVRARVGLVEAQEARDADCTEIQADLLRAYDRGVKASGRARKHMRSCSGCTEYRAALRGMRRSFAALSPVGVGPLALAAKVLGIFGGGGAAAGGAAAGGGGAAVAGGGLAAGTACKVAAVVCTAAIATGGAVEVKHQVSSGPPTPVAEKPTPKKRTATAAKDTPPVLAEARGGPQVQTLAPARTSVVAPPKAEAKQKKAAADTPRKLKQTPAAALTVPVSDELPAEEPTTVPAETPDPQADTGGYRAPDPAPTATPIPAETPAATPQAPAATPVPSDTAQPPVAESPGAAVAPPAPAATP